MRKMKNHYEIHVYDTDWNGANVSLVRHTKKTPSAVGVQTLFSLMPYFCWFLTNP